MKPEQLDTIADESAQNLKTLISESNREILEAVAFALEQAQEEKEDTGVLPKVKISLNHKLEIDLVKFEQLDRLTWSVIHKQEIVSVLPDPNQTTIDFP